MRAHIIGGHRSSLNVRMRGLRQPLGDCPAMDCNGTGPVTIDCVVAAIGAALDGCYAAP